MSSTYSCEFINVLEDCIIKNIKNDDLNDDNIIYFCTCKSEIITKYISTIIEKSTIGYNDKSVDAILKNLKFAKHILLSFVSKGLVITEEHILTTIKHCEDTDAIDCILNIASSQNNFTITKKMFESLMERPNRLNHNDIIIFRNPKYLMDDDRKYYIGTESTYIPDNLQLLLKYGYKLDQ